MQLFNKTFLFITLVSFLSCSPLAASGEPPQNPSAAPILGLEDFIHIGLQNNPAITAARSRIQAAEGKRTQARSGYLPQLSASGETAHLEQIDVDTDGSNDVMSGVVSARQLIFDFGKTTGAISASAYNIESEKAQLNSVGAELVYLIKAAFYNVIADTYLIQVANEQVHSYQMQYDRAGEYFKAGVRSKIDVTNAQVELNNANLQLLQSQFALKSAKVTLERLIGVKPANGNYLLQSTDSDLKEFVTLLDPLPATLTEMLHTASLQRPDLKQAQEQIHSAESTVSQKQGEYWPEIMAKGSYNTYNTEHDTPFLMDQWQVSIGIDWQFFSGLRTKGEVAEAKSNLRATRAQKRDRELLSIQEVTDSYYLAEEKRASVFLADKILKLAEENMELADERYKTGLGDMIEFNDAQVRLTQARSNLVTTFFAYNTALAHLDFAVGIYPDLSLKQEQ